MNHAPPPPRARRGSLRDFAAAGRATGGAPALPAPELLEHLVVATHDLDRLQQLLDDAGQALATHFQAAATQMKLLRRDVTARPDMNLQPLEVAMDHLSAAITSLAFRDLATQLLEQAGGRLRHCAVRLGGSQASAASAAPEAQTEFLDTVRLAFEPPSRRAEPPETTDSVASIPAPAPA